MLEEHKAELRELKADYESLEGKGVSLALWSLVEGRISDLESMIAQDEYWQKRGN